MKLVEQHRIDRQNPRFAAIDPACFASKNLYNATLYILTPGRVCQGMQNILVAIGTPTRACKPRGIAPGWSIGRVRKQRERFHLVYSKRWRIKRAHQQPKIPGQKPKRGRPKKIKPILAA